MNAISKKRIMAAVILLSIMALSAWFYLHMRLKQSALNKNCSAIIEYHHQRPDGISFPFGRKP